MGRWLLVVIVAWGIRRGLPPIDMLGLLTRAVPHRDSAWRQGVIDDAMIRNNQRRDTHHGF